MDIIQNVKKNISEAVPFCPNCNKAGQKVNIKTVRSLVNKEMADIKEAQYFICVSPECSISYYTENGLVFRKDDLTVPIWFKEQSPFPVCYCKNVSDTDILEHIVNRKCCKTIEDLQEHTGANTGKECLTSNPLGK